MEKLSINKALSEALLQVGKKHRNLVLLNSDFSHSLELEPFLRAFGERSFNFGLAEENMVSASIGFVARGKIPVVVAYSAPLMKAFEQIRGICFSNLNVKIVGVGGGLISGEDGAAYQTLEDIALMRSLPNMKVICPAGYYEALNVMEKVFLDYGPAYVRLPMADLPTLFGEEETFDMRLRILREGEDVCIFAHGAVLGNCLKAAELLAVEGISVKVANVTTVKPLAKKEILDCCRGVKKCLSVEDHSVIGGLGDALSEVLVEKGILLKKIGVKDRFGESGKWEDLYRKYQLDIYGICEQVRGFWNEA